MPHPQNVGNRQITVLLIRKTFAWPHFKRFPVRFQTAPTSIPEQRDQAPHLLIFLGSKTLLKPAKPSIDSLHRLLCLFGNCGAGRSTSIDMELVTTFSGETNWSSTTNGLLVVAPLEATVFEIADFPLREQAILTVKVLLIAGGALGVLTLLDQMVVQKGGGRHPKRVFTLPAFVALVGVSSTISRRKRRSVYRTDHCRESPSHQQTHEVGSE